MLTFERKNPGIAADVVMGHCGMDVEHCGIVDDPTVVPIAEYHASIVHGTGFAAIDTVATARLGH